MASLLDSRVQISLKAFARIAVDFAGFFITIQDRGKKRQNRICACLLVWNAEQGGHFEMARY